VQQSARFSSLSSFTCKCPKRSSLFPGRLLYGPETRRISLEDGNPADILTLRHFPPFSYCLTRTAILSGTSPNDDIGVLVTWETEASIPNWNRFRSVWLLDRSSVTKPGNRQNKQRTSRARPGHVPAPPCQWGAASPVSCAGSHGGCSPRWARSDPRPLLRPRPSPAAAGSTRTPRCPGRRRAGTLLSRPISSARPARDRTVSEVEEGNK
jgi:hypothetical protein